MTQKYLKFILFLTLGFTWTSCDKYLDVNDDPNNPTVVAPEIVLPVAQTSVCGSIGGDFAIIGGMWSQHWTQSHISSQYKTIDAYDLTPGDYNVSWTEMYAGGLNDLETVRTQAEANENWTLYLIATCVQSYGFHILADWFDKIPYNEALKGVRNLNPKFDDGSAVYAGLIAALDNALGKDFSNSASGYISSDLVYPVGNKDGQVDAWKRFANTLKLKIYMRQSASSQSAAAKTAIQAMMDAGTPFLEADAAITQFVDEPNRSNFLYENNIRQLNTGGNLRLSATLESYLENAGDQDRLEAYFEPTVTGAVYTGLQQGNYEALTSVICTGCVSIAKMGPTDPFFLMSLDESLFLQAEAALWLGDDAVAEGLYAQAVDAAYGKFGLATPASLFAAGGVYEYPSGGSFAEKHEAIMMQKWVAMYRQGYESFFDQARTGYPRTSSVPGTDPGYVPGEWTYSVNGVTGGAFPKRLLFPSASSDVNANTPAVIPVTTKIWWMP